MGRLASCCSAEMRVLFARATPSHPVVHPEDGRQLKAGLVPIALYCRACRSVSWRPTVRQDAKVVD